MALLYHLVPAAAWAEAKAAAEGLYTPPTYEQDGFTHLTADPALLLGVANHFYAGVPGPYLVVELDPARLTGRVVFEPAAPVGSTPALKVPAGGGEQQQQQQQPEGQQPEQQQQQQQQGQGEGEGGETLFPHLYAPIDTAAAVRELAVDRAPDGKFLAIHGLP